jgi:general secretion pathway protein M
MRLSSSARRALALALLLGLVALTIGSVGLPLWHHHRAQAELLEIRADALAHFERVVSGLEDRRAELARLEAAPELARFVLARESPTLAAARLQEQVKSVVEAHDGRLISVHVLDPAEAGAGAFLRVGLGIRLSVDMEGLQQVLHELEGGRPALFVDDLVILSRSARGTRGGETAIPDLDIRFRISGFLASPPSPAGGA